MKQKMFELIEELQSDKNLNTFDEAATKQAIILRILSNLGWNHFNIKEVTPEYKVGIRKVDYSLRENNINKVFIEVKKVDEDLEKHQKQLLDYSFQEGTKIAILTNGITWWFYLPLNEGNWEQRKVYTIEIYDQDANKISESFIDFLSKENIISGQAVKLAENIHKSKQKKYVIGEKLPEAWHKLINEPDEDLVELLAETTEKICGYKPDHITVGEFLSSFIEDKGKIPPKKSKINKKTASNSKKGFTGKKISSYTFNGKEFEVKYWIYILMEIANLMAKLHENEFDKALSLKGRKRPYFTRNETDLRSPWRVEGTDIYMEVNMNANTIVRVSKNLIALFGYKDEDLKINVET